MSIETQGSKEMQEFIYQIDENLTDELKLIAKKIIQQLIMYFKLFGEFCYYVIIKKMM